jgi:hypothetical protein
VSILHQGMHIFLVCPFIYFRIALTNIVRYCHLLFIYKTLSKDKSVIKGLADGCLKEDKPLGTRSGLVRGSLAAKACIFVANHPFSCDLIMQCDKDFEKLPPFVSSRFQSRLKYSQRGSMIDG